jgi:hypothetical protein
MHDVGRVTQFSHFTVNYNELRDCAADDALHSVKRSGSIRRCNRNKGRIYQIAVCPHVIGKAESVGDPEGRC